MNEKPKSDEKFAKWRGLDRTEIDWSPKIDLDKCTGCGMCITGCGRAVFDYDQKNKKSIVARPLQCMVGCTSCETWCIYNAISFPDREYVKDLIKEKGLLKVAKKELEQKYSKKECCGGEPR